METAFVTSEEWVGVVDAVASGVPKPDCRRQDLRHPMSFGLAIVSYTNRLSRAAHRYTDMAVLDLSRTGLMLRSQHDIPRNAEVEIDIDLWEWRGMLRARVAHCTQTLAGYKVGLELVFDAP